MRQLRSIVVVFLGVLLPLSALTETPSEDCTQRKEYQEALADYSCRVEWSASQCEQYFQKKPELKDLARICPSTSSSGRDILDVISGCGVGAGDAFYETVKGLVLLPWELLKALGSVVNSGAKAQVVLNACAHDLECKVDLYRRAYGAEPKPGDITKLAEKKSGREIYSLWERAVIHDYENSRIRQRELAEKVRELGRKHQMGSPEWLAGMRVLVPDYDKRVEQAKRTLGSILRGFWEEKKQALSCLNTEASTEMVCHAIFSIVDPTLAAGFLAKAPRLARLLKHVDEAAPARLPAGAFKSAEEAMQFHKGLGFEQLQHLPAEKLGKTENAFDRMAGQGKSVYAKVTRATLDGEEVVVKRASLEKITEEARIYELLRKSGVDVPYRGVVKLENNQAALVTKFADGQLLKCVEGVCNLLRGGSAQAKVTEETFAEMRRIGKQLDELGVDAKDMQFMVTKEGKAVLFDVGEYQVKGARITHENFEDYAKEIRAKYGTKFGEQDIRMLYGTSTSNQARAEMLIATLKRDHAKQSATP